MSDYRSKRSRGEATKIATVLRDRHMTPEAQQTARAAVRQLEARGYRMPSPTLIRAQRAQAALGLGSGGRSPDGSSQNSPDDDRKRAREILDILRDHYLDENKS
ncbi:MAG: hypothetical protein ORO03_08370 [Alphaproteobacteria bacterium]|nr:hypothetical protein [Alphaproteobacteria bacterium]